MPRGIAILTGGGDVPGLNSAIKQLVWRMEESGYEVLGLRRGWAALLHIRPGHDPENERWIVPLTRAATRTVNRSGGTMLHSSRINPALTRSDGVPEHLQGREHPRLPDGRFDLTGVALATLEQLKLDALIAIGGDGTLSFARRLHDEGAKIIGIPKTMDNDVCGTDYCIGFSTAISRSVQFIGDLRTVAGSHERFLVVELFGRYSGETCLLASYLAGTDRALIAEIPFDPQRVVALLADDKRANPSNYAVVALSEGAYPLGGQPFETGEADAAGNRELGGVGRYLRQILQEETNDRVIYQRLGYLMRSGPPDTLDRLVASNFANLAADLILAGKTGRLTALVGGRYTAQPLEITGEGRRQVNVARLYDAGAYRTQIAGVMGLPMFLF